MSYRIILTAFLKAMIFTGSLLAVSLVLKFSLPFNSQLSVHHNGSLKDTTFYFIGSSRVQQSISPNILKTHLPNYNFINLGLASNSFLYSCKIASNLLKEPSAKKIIFIELTGLSIQPSNAYYFLLKQADVWNIIKQHLSIQCTPTDIISLLFYMFSTHNDIKKIIYPEFDLYNNPELGYLASTREFKASTTAILKPESFDIKAKISPSLLNAYLQNINLLQTMAADSNSEIIFILPLTIIKVSEFNIDMAVFTQLPDSSKWTYSNDFLNAMKDSRFLFDELHLNEAGANSYSQELSKFIKERWIVSKEMDVK